MIIATDETKGLLVSSLFFVDQKIQDSLYEALSTGKIDRDRFKELTGKLAEWQSLSKSLISIINN